MILLVSFAGEVLKLALPFPVPGSIYGMLLLCTGVIRLEHVRETGLFLVEIMPILFVSAGVGLMDSWGDLRKILLPVLLIMLVTTVIVMVVSGYATQFIMHHKTKKKQPKD